MGFNKRTNCIECGHPLHLQDLKNSQWIDDDQEFNFVCSACGRENLVKFGLFNKNGHIEKSYLSIIKDDKDYLTGERLSRFYNHINNCELCKNELNEEYILEVEEKIKFNERSLLYFTRNSQDIFKKLTKLDYERNNDHIKWFSYFCKFKIDEDDEFYRYEKKDYLQICYYLRQNSCLSGMVCFSIVKEDVILEKIWLRSEENLKKEQELFRLLKEGKIKIKLDTIKKIFKALHN